MNNVKGRYSRHVLAVPNVLELKQVSIDQEVER